MNVLLLDDRKALIKEIESDENTERKRRSVYQNEVFKNKLEDKVRKRLLQYLSPTSVKQIAIVKSVGMCKRIVKQEASIYRENPKRHFEGLNDDQLKKIIDLYEAMQYDEKSKTHNRIYKLQGQSLSMILPKNGKLIKRVLREHHYDIIPNEADPESPLGIVLSNVNRPEERSNQRYVVWTPEYNFTMDGNGIILTDTKDMVNAIGKLPFVVASVEKDGEYFPDEEEPSVDFTVDLNAALSELFHVMRMQGFGQAVMSGSKKALPEVEEIEVGINSIICLLTDDGAPADFKFVNANPDLAGSIEVIGTLLSAFLTSKGLDPKVIAIKGDAPQGFSSGWERFLSLIEKFEATKDDLEVFRNVEKEEFELIKAWHNVAIGNDLLRPEYIASELPAASYVVTEFARPEAIMTEGEKVEAIRKSEDNGYISHLEAIRRAHNLDSQGEALLKWEQIQEENKLYPAPNRAQAPMELEAE